MGEVEGGAASAAEAQETSRLWNKRRKKLSKQLSMLQCDSPRDMAWEKRRRQILKQERKNKQQGLSPAANNNNNNNNESLSSPEVLTDEDLNELKGSIELGFGFNEEDGQRLCNTLPALDFYFAVNRRFSTSPLSSPNGASTAPPSACLAGPGSASYSSLPDSSSPDSPRSDLSDSWKICTPGENPQQVKTKLRHWAQAVACSVLQSH
ncbi:hypothetical protein NMG60_11023579 [Bertholletia excelsa]